MKSDEGGAERARRGRLERYAEEVVAHILDSLRAFSPAGADYQQFTMPRKFLLSTWERGRSRSVLLQELISARLCEQTSDSDAFLVRFAVGLVLDDDSGEVRHSYVEFWILATRG